MIKLDSGAGFRKWYGQKFLRNYVHEFQKRESVAQRPRIGKLWTNSEHVIISDGIFEQNYTKFLSYQRQVGSYSFNIKWCSTKK